MKQIRILHISDIHLDNDSKEDFNNLIQKPFFETLKKETESKKIDLVFLTGDLINKGTGGFSTTDDAFRSFNEIFLEPLQKVLSINKDDIIICPGNHDVNRTLDNPDDDKALYEDAKDQKKLSEIIGTCREIKAYPGLKKILPFKSFEKDYYKNVNDSYITLFDSFHERKIQEIDIGILALNTAWSPLLYDSKILLGKDQIENHKAKLSNNTINILLSHYQLDNCLDLDTSISALTNPFNLFCCGHKHSTASQIIQNPVGNKIAYSFSKGLMQYNIKETDYNYVNGFSLINLNIQETLESIEIQPFVYSKDFNKFVPDTLATGKNNSTCYNYKENSSSITSFDRNKYLLNIKAQAGNRYTPLLNVKVPVYKLLDSFSKKISISNTLTDEINQLLKYKGNQYFMKELPDWAKRKFVESTINAARIDEVILQIHSIGNELIKTQKTKLIDSINTVIQNLLEILTIRSKIEIDFLRSKYGKKYNDPSVVEPEDYNTLVELRQVYHITDNINKLINSLNFKAYFSNCLYITGPGGIGKTHCLTDYVCNDSSAFIFFGEDFSTDEPWKTMINKLGFPSTYSKEQLFNFFSSTASSNGSVGIIFIDAINESKNFEKWNKWLPVLLSDLEPYENLKLCISCRDTYVNDVIDGLDNWLEYTHNGFLGIEYIAVKKFCEFYKITPPLYPCFSADICNPLFLQMICENIKSEGSNEFPREQIGIKGIFEKNIELKNIKISKICDIDVEDNIVQKFITNIAKYMLVNNIKIITYDEYKNISNQLFPSISFSKSIFNQCEKENIFTKIKKDGKIYIRFTYERFCDFYLAKNLININIKKYLTNENFISNNHGVLEVIAVLLPEYKSSNEILDFNRSENVIRAFLKSLSLRSKYLISKKTQNYIYQILNREDLCYELITSLLEIAITPNNPFNIIFITNLLSKIKLPNRDAVFSKCVIMNYQNEGVVKVLVDSDYFETFNNLTIEAKELWILTLALFCSVSDRRIRDKSSKIMTLFLSKEISLTENLITQIKNYDDEYIIERITSAIYSSILITSQDTILLNISNYIINNNLLSIYSNILIQDNLKLILGLAKLKGLISNETYLEAVKNIVKTKFKKPNKIKYRIILHNKIFQDMNINFVGHWYTDFQRYILYNHIEDFDLQSVNLDFDDIYRWFVIELYKLGYPGKKNKAHIFDKNNTKTYGSGRGKFVYPERLSKKYYWIFYHRLFGLLKNTCLIKETAYSYNSIDIVSELFSLQIRDIDLSDIRFALHNNYPDFELKKIDIDTDLEPKKWVTSQIDFYNEIEILKGIEDKNNQVWIPLNFVQNLKVPYKDDKDAYKDTCILISAALISNEDLNSLDEQKIKELTFGNVFQNIIKDYTLYLGEYPYSLAYEHLINSKEREEIEYRQDSRKIFPASYEMLRGKEWEYDCSFDSDDCLFPSKFLIEELNLHWDSNSAWYVDNISNIVVISKKINDSVMLFIRKDMIEKINADYKIIFRVYQEKMFSKGWGSTGGIHSYRSIYTIENGNVKELLKYEDDNNFHENVK